MNAFRQAYLEINKVDFVRYFNDLKNGSANYFENNLKSMHIS